MLAGNTFYRVHKSHLVNLSYVVKYVPGEGGYLILEDGSHVDVSRRKKEGLLKILMS
jgi:two-component system LytT family response regulator